MPTPNRDVQSTAPASLESLESRRLLSATLWQGLLTVDGTRRSDNITVGFASPRTLRVVVNGQESLFARKAVERIRVRAGTGDDGVVFLTNTPYAFAVRLVVSGGAGNDSLMGSDSADTLLGEDGNDYVEGWGGNDVIRGGAGNDNLRGRDGDDQVFGESGNDDLIGMTGDDTLFGGSGDDVLHEDDGRDRVLGGDGRDHFYFFESPKDVRDESRREAIDPEPPVSMPFILTGQNISQLVGGAFQGAGAATHIGASLTSLGSYFPPTSLNLNSGVTSYGGTGGVTGTLTLSSYGQHHGSVTATSGGSTSGGVLHIGGLTITSPAPIGFQLHSGGVTVTPS